MHLYLLLGYRFHPELSAPPAGHEANGGTLTHNRQLSVAEGGGLVRAQQLHYLHVQLVVFRGLIPVLVQTLEVGVNVFLHNAVGARYFLPEKNR